MPAEGAMRTPTEAPVLEPRHTRNGGAGVVLEGIAKAFGDVRALDGVSLRADPRETVAIVGPSGCGKSTLLERVCGLLEPDEGTLKSPPAALMPQRDGLLPWLSALDNAGLAQRVAGAPRPPAGGGGPGAGAAFWAGGGAGAVRGCRAGRLRGRAAGRAVGRDAPARRVPPHPPGGQARAVPRRAL